MKIPQSPPALDELWKLGAEKAMHIVSMPDGPLVGGKYLHWDKLRYRTPPPGLTAREWWLGVKFRRTSLYTKMPLTDRVGDEFRYILVDPIPEMIHRIDLGGGGFIRMPGEIANPETKDQYYVSSLMDEAITSSQLEGATTTRPVAKEMIRTGRQPRDKSERMILNNFLAMRRIVALKERPLDKDLVFEIHRIVTDETLDDPSAAGRFRLPSEQIRIEGPDGEVVHDPPVASTLESRMERMCDFANSSSGEPFIHPVLRSIALHFWLSCDHPFVDGNGRTARALFYWSMLHHGYWLCEFISISQMIKKSAVSYARAFLNAETDGNDLTYFLIYHLRIIHLAIEELHRYVARKTAEIKALESRLQGMDLLNHRQRALVSHALRHPNQRYTIESHRTSHNVVYQTARTDLLDLAGRGLLRSVKVGKTYYFIPEQNLDQKLAALP
ncbi:MAG TPA: Fic family protein [Pirellulales bacterium]|jgi:Fic family protein|nr:Fic family protein [Pirellulales bacterium]